MDWKEIAFQIPMVIALVTLVKKLTGEKLGEYYMLIAIGFAFAVVGLATHHSTFIGGIFMDKFDRYLECMDNKIAELDAEIQHLQAEKDILSTMRIRADVFKTLPEDEECINWP